jgi:hypothetical protein
MNLDGGCWPHEFRNIDGAVGLVVELIIGFLKFVRALRSIYNRRVTWLVDGGDEVWS